MCRVFLGVTDAETVTMMALDRLGVDLRVVTTAGATSEFRVAFRETVTCRFDAQSALVKALQESWEKENGTSWLSPLVILVGYSGHGATRLILDSECFMMGRLFQLRLLSGAAAFRRLVPQC